MASYNGVILGSDDEDLTAIAELLTARLRDRLEYKTLQHVHQLDMTQSYDFIVFDNVSNMHKVAERYKDSGTEAPLLIHLVYEDKIDLNNPYMDIHAMGFTVAPIRQAPLDRQDTTLQFDLFERILEVLDAT